MVSQRIWPLSLTAQSTKNESTATAESARGIIGVNGRFEGSALSSVWRPPTNYRSFDAPIGFYVLPYPIAPSAQQWNDIRPVVILAEYLKRPVDWWRSF